MSNASAPVPGWYPDPQRSAALRWWDGVRWTEHVSPAPGGAPRSPYAPAPRRQLPAETPVYTVWIWLVAVLPLISSLLVFLLHPQPVFRGVPGSSTVVITDPFALLGGPMYFVVVGIGWLLTAAGIVFSWLDYRELTRRGVERPFHWAWSFLGIVYTIGRSIVVRGVAAGRGLAPLWVAIAVYIASFAIGVTWSILLVAQILGTVSDNVPLGT
ncbi:DUF2510 domain-containing protein [Leifsonia sp. LS-T14]|uniref:DUF2510 domain-containing protein n=1 Tax=unclassified Leifsonia TaxID=2663824 RepID=UPI0035A69809